MALDGRKIYISEDWLEELIKNINLNIKINEDITKNDSSIDRTQQIDDNKKLIEKLDKYKKNDSEGYTFYYLFPNELESIFWILLENNSVFGVSDNL